MARPRIPVLVGTVALLAGCGSQARVEVSGVVRDGETGRVIANALVVGADGSSTRTDADGRFSLFVRGDERRSIRASAWLHEDGLAYFDPRVDAREDAMAFELAPLRVSEHAALDGLDAGALDRTVVDRAALDRAALDRAALDRAGPARIEEDDPDAVLRWVREAWLDDSTTAPDDDLDPMDARDAAQPSWSRDAIASLARGGFEARDAAVTIAHAGVTACGTCHTADAAMVSAVPFAPPTSLAARTEAPHAALEGGCLACHGERAAEGVRARRGVESDLEPARCAGCHAGERPADLRALRAPAYEATARAEAAFARAVTSVRVCGHTASSVARIDGVLLLVDARGLALGDCDASGAIDGSEVAIGLEVLEPRVARAARDLALLRADRSRGIHQPDLTRAVAERVERALH